MRQCTTAILATVLFIPCTSLAQSETTLTPNPDAILWEPTLSSAATVLPTTDGEASSARFNPTSDLIAISCAGAVVVREVAGGSEVRKFKSAIQWCPAAWRPHSNEIAICDSQRSVSVYSIDGALLFHITDLPADVVRLVWAPSGEKLAIGGQDGMLQVYSVVERKVTERIDVGHKTVFAIAYAPSEDRMAIRTQDECVTIEEAEKSGLLELPKTR